MSVGQGSMTVNQRRSAGGGSVPPFPINSAENGASVDPGSFRIVLGQAIGEAGDPGRLLSNREIPLNGFVLTLGENSVSPNVQINPGANLVTALTPNFRIAEGGFLLMDINRGAGIYQIGDLSGFGNNTAFSIDDTNQVANISVNTIPYFQIDQVSKVYTFGDLTSSGNGNHLFIDDLNNETYVGDPNYVHPVLGIYGTPPASQNIELYNEVAAASQLLNLGLINFSSGLSRYFLEIDSVNRYQNRFDVNDPVNGDFYTIQTVALSTFKNFLIDFTNQIYKLGDLDGQFNSTQLNIDDTARNTYLGSPNINNSYLNIYGFDGAASGFELWAPDNLALGYTDIFSNNSGGSHSMQFAANDNVDTLEMTMLLDGIADNWNVAKFTGGTRYRKILIDYINNLYKIGDINAEINGTNLNIDDGAGIFYFSNTGNTSAININGVAGFTGTVTPVNSITVDGGIVTNVT